MRRMRCTGGGWWERGGRRSWRGGGGRRPSAAIVNRRHGDGWEVAREEKQRPNEGCKAEREGQGKEGTEGWGKEEAGERKGT